MAINPEFLTCTICDTPNAYPFDFLRTPEQEAEMQAIREDRADKSERGWTCPQFISHDSRVLLCDDHHDQASALRLDRVARAEGLAQLRTTAGSTSGGMP